MEHAKRGFQSGLTRLYRDVTRRAARGMPARIETDAHACRYNLLRLRHSDGRPIDRPRPATDRPTATGSANERKDRRGGGAPLYHVSVARDSRQECEMTHKGKGRIERNHAEGGKLKRQAHFDAPFYG